MITFSRPAADLWELVCGMAPAKRGRRHLAVLQAYIDDSGNLQDSALVLAGYIASVEQWAAFAEEWRRVLDMPLAIKYFKMNDAYRLNGEFTGFSERRRDERVQLLYEVIENNVAASVCCVVPVAAFNQAKTLFPIPVKLHPYHIAFIGLISGLNSMQNEVGLDGKVDFIFDDQVMEKTALLDSWDWLMKIIGEDLRLNVGKPPIFKDDHDILPLQAADLAAWWVRRWYEEQVIGRTAPEQPWIDRRDIPFIYRVFDESQIRDIFQGAIDKVMPPSGVSPA